MRKIRPSRRERDKKMPSAKLWPRRQSRRVLWALVVGLRSRERNNQSRVVYYCTIRQRNKNMIFLFCPFLPFPFPSFSLLFLFLFYLLHWRFVRLYPFLVSEVYCIYNSAYTSLIPIYPAQRRLI